MKERILYFDVIKVLAVICVFVSHFARTLEYYQISYSFKILPDNIFSVYTGTVGCVLFYIVSGAALMYMNQERLNLKSYFLKRLKGIYPMFWIAFIIFFALRFYIEKGYDKSIPIWRMVFSFTGFDGLAGFYCPTFYTVGEWFLGVLVILYILFPILRKLTNDFPYATLAVSTLIGLIVDYTYDNPYISVTIIPIVWIPAFVFGMVFIKNIKNVGTYLLVISMVVLALFTIFDFGFCQTMTRIYIVGTALFFILVHLFKNTKGNIIRSVSAFVSKYCYPIFLVHHRMMFIFMARFSGYQFSVGDVVCLFVFMILVSLAASYFIDRMTNSVLRIWRSGNA